MTKITYRSDPNDPLVPQPGRPIRSEVVQENFQVLANAGGLWAYDTVVNVDVDADTGDNLMTRSGSTVTVVTERDHGFQVADTIIVSGADGATTDYNGEFTVSAVLDTTTFTYSIGSTPPSPATGTIIVRLKNKVGVTGGVFYISDAGYGSNNPVFFSETTSPELDTTVDGSATGGSAGEELYALLTVDETETLVWTKGDWASPGNANLPTFPLLTFEIPICLALVVFNQAEIESTSITDVRPLIRI